MSFDLSGYVDVAERIRIFREKHPSGSLQPVNPEKPYEVVAIGERMFIVYAAAAYRDSSDPKPGIGVAWEPFPGRTTFTKDSELMNAETSAWGRAIIAALAADTQKIASAEEVRNRQSEGFTKQDDEPIPFKPTREQMIARADQRGKEMKQKATVSSVNISDAQLRLLNKLASERNLNIVEFASERIGRNISDPAQLTKKEASGLLNELMNQGR
jgi:hypothetical protein